MIDFTKASTTTGRLERENIRKIQEAYQAAYNDIEQQIKQVYANPKNLDATGNLIGPAIIKTDRLQKTQTKIAEALKTAGTDFKGVLDESVKETYKVNFDYGAKSLGELETGIDFGMINREAVAKAAISELALTAVEENTTAVIAAVKKTITTAIVSGQSIDTMAARIRKDLQNNANNAVRIARTETTRIMGEARDELLHQAQELGLHVVKVWIATSDDRTRESHAHINGEERELDQPFSNGLMYPGDTSAGDPGETINCRCAMAAKTIPTPEQARSMNVSIQSAVRQNDKQMQAEYDAWKAAKALAKNNVAQVRQPEFNFKNFNPMSKSEIKAQEQFLKTLPQTQQTAIKDYTGDAYVRINRDLRSGVFPAKDYGQLVANLDEAFRTAPALESNLVVSRTVASYDKVFGPGIDDLVTRAKFKNISSYSPEAFEQLKKKLIGTVITDNGFISTTSSETVTKTIAFALPKGYNNGMYIESLSHFPSEQEFLINRGQTFVVRDIIHTERAGLLQIVLAPKP